jgi:hypothetical protein
VYFLMRCDEVHWFSPNAHSRAQQSLFLPGVTRGQSGSRACCSKEFLPLEAREMSCTSSSSNFNFLKPGFD